MRSQNGTVVGFGRQFTWWGSINAILAAFGLSSAKRNLEQQVQGEINALELALQAKNSERLVRLNVGLDAGYIASSALLATESPKQGDKPEERRVSFRNGVGLVIVAQGAFLLIWHILLSLLAQKGRKA